MSLKNLSAVKKIPKLLKNKLDNKIINPLCFIYHAEQDKFFEPNLKNMF